MNNNTTPTGSTTKLVADKWSRSSGWWEGGGVLVLLSLSFSLPNIVRLPRMAYLHGAGGFMAAYLVLMCVLGLPLVFLEILLGQLCQQGATKLSRAVPLLKGVGYVKLICSLLVGAYYPVIMSVSLFYALWTIKGPLPFTECSSVAKVPATVATSTLATVTSTAAPAAVLAAVTPSSSPLVAANHILPVPVATIEKIYTADGESCLLETFLKPPSIDPMWFGVNVTLLFLLWAFILLCVCRAGSSYKVSGIWLIMGLVGCSIALGVHHFLAAPWHPDSPPPLSTLIYPDWKAVLLSFDTWYYAAIQVFFSAHIGFGNIVTCSGNIYSKTNPFWSAAVYTVANSLVGVGAVCLVYYWLEQRVPYAGLVQTAGEIVSADQYYTYATEAQGASNWSGAKSSHEFLVLTLIYDVAVASAHTESGLLQPAWWPLIAYLLVILAGFASVVCVVYSVSMILVVETKKRVRWWLVAATLSSILFVAGIALLLPERLSGVHVLDDCVVGRAVAMTTALELVGFMWIYGVRTLATDFEFLLGHSLSPVWIVVWSIAPIFLVAMEVWSLFGLVMTSSSNPIGEDGVWAQRDWLELAGWLLYAALWLIIIVFAIYQISQQVDYNLAQKFLSSVKPSRKWGPVDPIYRHGWVQWRNQYQATGERDFTLKRRGTRDYTHSIARSTADMNPSPHQYSSGTAGRRGVSGGGGGNFLDVEASVDRRPQHQHRTRGGHINNNIMMTPLHSSNNNNHISQGTGNNRETAPSEQPRHHQAIKPSPPKKPKKSSKVGSPPVDHIRHHSTIISAWETPPNSTSVYTSNNS